jgi:hypothetical protein
MTKGISKKAQQAGARRKRQQGAAALAAGDKKPVAAVPIASAAKRGSASLPAMRYPVKKVSTGKRQEAGVKP